MLYIKGHPDVKLSFPQRKTRSTKKRLVFSLNTQILRDKTSTSKWKWKGK